MSAGVWAVFSTFRPDSAAQRAVASVAGQVEGVVVVDDGSDPSCDPVLDSIEAEGATVVRQRANTGIAAALNAGIAIARDGGAESIVTFDQDSVVPAGFVAALVRTLVAEDRADAPVGVVVPEFFADVRQARAGLNAANVIQSGMLIPLRVMEEVGALREDFFIDLVDTEFELRLRRHGRRVIAAPGTRLGHSLGVRYRRELAGREVRLPGIPPVITLSTPFRYFYRVRNRLVLNREYFRDAPRKILRDSVLDAIHFVNALWIAAPRGALWRVYRAAVLAAVRGRMGRMPAELQGVAARVRWRAPEMVSGPPPASEPVRVSVCMATYNGAAFIAEQLESVFAELEADDEVIVVDDASSDDTVEIVRAFGDPRVRLHRHTENAGYVRTFEEALTLATGEVMLLADQDDVWIPGRRNLLVEAARGGRVAASNLVLLGSEAPLPSPVRRRPWRLAAARSRQRIRNQLRILAGIAPYFGCAMAVHRDVAARILPFPDFLSESHDLWIATFANQHRILRHVEEPTILRRLHASNTSPSRPRSLLPVLRARLMLVRAWREARRR